MSRTATNCLIRVKAVPGARSDQIVGPLGDRLKVRVGAPPEGGKANRAITALIAAAIGRKRRDVTIDAGMSSAEKTIRVAGARAEDLAAALDLSPPDRA